MAVRLADVGEQDWFELGMSEGFRVRGSCTAMFAVNADFRHCFTNCFAVSSSDSCATSLSANMHGAYSQAPRHSANSSVSLPSAVVSPGLHASFVAQVLEHFLAAAQGTTDRAADPGPHLAVRLVLLEEAVERQRVLHLGRREFEQLGDFDHRFQRHVAQVAR